MFDVQASLIIMGCVHFKAAFLCTGVILSRHGCPMAEFTHIDTVFSDTNREEMIDSRAVFTFVFLLLKYRIILRWFHISVSLGSC